MLSVQSKQEINKAIFLRAYEIEEELSADNFFLAKMAGLKECDVPDVSLKCAVKELIKTLSE